MVLVYFSLGANIGFRQFYISEAVKLLKKDIGKILSESSVYKTASWGYDDAFYLNKVVVCRTNFKPLEILNRTKNIENKLGRESKTTKDNKGNYKYSARTIDIDILFYASEILSSDELTVPHRQLHKRNFVLSPLNEIAPDFIHPVLNKKISYLYKNCFDKLDVKKIAGA